MLNKFLGIGRWSQDIELRYTKSGTPVASSTIAINERYGDKENTTFLPVVMWSKLAEVVVNHSGKGRLVAIEGRIQVRSWDSENGKRYATEIVAESVKFLESPNSQNNTSNERGNTNTPSGNQSGSGGHSGGHSDTFADDGKPIDISPDDLPF